MDSSIYTVLFSSFLKMAGNALSSGYLYNKATMTTEDWRLTIDDEVADVRVVLNEL